MEYYLVVFRSRTQTMNFNQLLRSYGVRANIINTPKQTSFSCSVSIKINNNGLRVALSILQRRKFDSIVGVYKVYDDGISFSIRPINS